MKVPIYNIRGTVVRVVEHEESAKSAHDEIKKAEASQEKPKDIKDLLKDGNT